MSSSRCLPHRSLAFPCSFYANVAIRGPNTCALAEWELAAAGKSCHWGAITLLESFRALTSVRPWDTWWDIKQAPVKSCECERFSDFWLLFFCHETDEGNNEADMTTQVVCFICFHPPVLFCVHYIRFHWNLKSQLSSLLSNFLHRLTMLLVPVIQE